MPLLDYPKDDTVADNGFSEEEETDDYLDTDRLSKEYASEERLLAANRALQKDLYQEYHLLLRQLDHISVLQKILAQKKNSHKKKTLLVRDEAQLDPSSKEENLSPLESQRITDYIAQFLCVRGQLGISPLDKAWGMLSHALSKPIPLCMQVWYSPENPHYLDSEFTAREDKEIISQEGNWSTLCQKMARAPLTIYARYKDLQKNQPVSRWTEKEDNLLREIIQMEGTGSWVSIATKIRTKSARQCMYRYMRVLSPDIKKGKWTEEEDQALLKAVELYKKGNWKKIKEHVPGRNDFQCRERYMHSLDPQRNCSSWTPEEEKLLLDTVAQAASKDWVKIAKLFTKRSGKQCRIKYNQLIKDAKS
ncbi:hypothetical protein NEHOM01_0985 [Nematocida homosporus]|uniref:uncharacterized protein n=1 Tax=Nematocida homosporus TaxID=1912981 RepID=UPI002220D3F8|nr:uncharacterized protein NEHOM01_0985 [Nematocida homosporus]KAI5185659.1 hypothetical protein NEHOM01_0985 [Nematocida homosporus]